MARNKSITLFLSAGVVLAIIVGAAGYFSPHIAMWRLSSAVKSRDTQAVMGYVDLPRFRQSLREEMRRVMRAGIAKETDMSNPFVMLGAKIAESAADYVIESMLTEENIVKILEGRNPDALKGPGSRIGDSAGDSTTSDARAGDAATGDSTSDESNRSTEIIRDSFGTFRLVFSEKSSPLFELLWEGNGLTGWKLVGIRLLAGAGEQGS